MLWRLAEDGLAFCSYIRWSAMRSASAGENASDGTSAMPMRAADGERVAGVRQRGGGERDNGFGARRLDRGEDAELVSAHPVGVADPVHGGPQALAEAGEKRVARWMAERVVVLLEAVEVEEREHDAALAAGVHQRRIEIVDQRAAVGKPGQRVGAGLLVTGAAMRAFSRARRSATARASVARRYRNTNASARRKIAIAEPAVARESAADARRSYSPLASSSATEMLPIDLS